MEGENLLIAGSLIGIIIVLSVIGVFIFDIITDSTSDDTSYSAEEMNVTFDNSTYDPNSILVPFDNSTPEATAKSIARLTYGVKGFYTHHKVNASLTSDGKYWIVNIDEGSYGGSVVTVDAKTLMSKQNGDMNQPANTWRSLDALKAKYIAEIQVKANEIVGEPSKVTMNGKEIWKVPVYNEFFDGQETYFWEGPLRYVYVDVATGKSKKEGADWIGIFISYINRITGTEGWKTLKEVDDAYYITKGDSDAPWPPFRDTLRDLYPE